MWEDAEDDDITKWEAADSEFEQAQFERELLRELLVSKPVNKPKKAAPPLKSFDDYEDDEDDTYTRSENIKFEKFAKEAMGALVEAGIADFVLLKNDKLRKWWQDVVKKELAAQAKREAIQRKAELKEQALAKLSDEEKEALGLIRKK